MAGHDPATGALLWEQPFPSGQPNVTRATPARKRPAPRLGRATGSGASPTACAANGAAMKATLEWESPRLKSKFANLVLHDGSVYGLDDGVLTCIDPASGERRWKDGRYGHGQLLLAADCCSCRPRRARSSSSSRRRRACASSPASGPRGQDVEPSRAGRPAPARAQRPRGRRLRAAGGVRRQRRSERRVGSRMIRSGAPFAAARSRGSMRSRHPGSSSSGGRRRRAVRIGREPGEDVLALAHRQARERVRGRLRHELRRSPACPPFRAAAPPRPGTSRGSPPPRDRGSSGGSRR